MTGIGAHQSPQSETVDWLTPPNWVQILGPFDLDPCCPPNMPWRTAATMWTRADDGLAHDWFGRVWCNPPYGPPKIIEPWMDRISKHANGIALIFARTETRCWFKYVWPCAHAVLFVEGRPHFHTPDGKRAPGNSGAPVALVAYGANNLWALAISAIAGKMVMLK
jgi:hypothetical protein